MEYRCVECGGRMTTLVVQYSPGNIRLMKCGNCKAVADEYVECEPIIILIDLILHKTKAYTHLLYNVIDPQAPSFQESLPGKKQGRMGLVHELRFVTMEISKDADGYCLWKYHVSFNLCTRYEDSFQHIPQTTQGWECPVILIIDLFVSSSNTGTQSDNSVTYEQMYSGLLQCSCGKVFGHTEVLELGTLRS